METQRELWAETRLIAYTVCVHSYEQGSDCMEVRLAPMVLSPIL